MTEPTIGAAMRSSYLIQRLQKPFQNPNSIFGPDNPFAFGGGLRNGGLSDDGMSLLRECFRFDYMGAAEFEWGAVPTALSKIAMAAEALRAFSFTIPLSEVAPHWKDRDEPAPAESGTVYVLCRSDDATEVERRIRFWAAHPFAARDHGDCRLMEPTHLNLALRPRDEWDTERCGWLELDNGFFFFTDQAMWEATSRLFGVEGKCASVPVDSGARASS